MVNNERQLICYKLLNEVFLDNAYGSILLNEALSSVKDEKDRAYISSLFYGVLEKNVQLDYILRSLAPKKARPAVEIVIKMGLYQMRYMLTPTYAAINETVEFVKKIGKGGVSGFVNAVLRKSENFSLPSEGELSPTDYLSVTFSVPKWIVGKLIKQYGYEFTKEFFAYEIDTRTHIRHNANVISKVEFEKKLSKLSRIEIKDSEFNKYMELIDKDLNDVKDVFNIDTEGLEAMINPYDIELELYKDEVSDGDMVDNVMKNNPKNIYNYFAVPKIIEG